LYLSALIEMGLILFLVTFIVNGLAKLLILSVARQTAQSH
jgi:ABC-type phosphate transport system permease subunit